MPPNLCIPWFCQALPGCSSDCRRSDHRCGSDDVAGRSWNGHHNHSIAYSVHPASSTDGSRRHDTLEVSDKDKHKFMHVGKGIAHNYHKTVELLLRDIESYFATSLKDVAKSFEDTRKRARFSDVSANAAWLFAFCITLQMLVRPIAATHDCLIDCSYNSWRLLQRTIAWLIVLTTHEDCCNARLLDWLFLQLMKMHNTLCFILIASKAVDGSKLMTNLFEVAVASRSADCERRVLPCSLINITKITYTTCTWHIELCKVLKKNYYFSWQKYLFAAKERIRYSLLTHYLDFVRYLHYRCIRMSKQVHTHVETTLQCNKTICWWYKCPLYHCTNISFS